MIRLREGKKEGRFSGRKGNGQMKSGGMEERSIKRWRAVKRNILEVEGSKGNLKRDRGPRGEEMIKGAVLYTEISNNFDKKVKNYKSLISL